MTAFEVLLPLIGAWALCSWMAQRTAEKRLLAEHLGQAAVLVDQHREALEKFLEHADAPLNLRRTALDMSDAFIDRKSMIGLAKLLVGDGPPPSAGGDFSEQLKALREKNFEAYELFIKACVTGMMAGLLRFKETSLMIEAAATRMATNREKDVEIAAATLPPPGRFDGGIAYA